MTKTLSRSVQVAKLNDPMLQSLAAKYDTTPARSQALGDIRLPMLQAGKVLFEYSSMMQFVSNNDLSRGAYADFMLVGHGLGLKVRKQTPVAARTP